MGMLMRGNQLGNVEILGGKTKQLGNQGDDAGNQGGNLTIAVEITWNRNANDKLKDWREVKMINLVSHIRPGAFLVNFGHICLSVFITDFKQVNACWEG